MFTLTFLRPGPRPATYFWFHSNRIMKKKSINKTRSVLNGTGSSRYEDSAGILAALPLPITSTRRRGKRDKDTSTSVLMNLDSNQNIVRSKRIGRERSKKAAPSRQNRKKPSTINALSDFLQLKNTNEKPKNKPKLDIETIERPGPETRYPTGKKANLNMAKMTSGGVLGSLVTSKRIRKRYNIAHSIKLDSPLKGGLSSFLTEQRRDEHRANDQEKQIRRWVPQSKPATQQCKEVTPVRSKKRRNRVAARSPSQKMIVEDLKSGVEMLSLSSPHHPHSERPPTTLKGAAIIEKVSPMASPACNPRDQSNQNEELEVNQILSCMGKGRLSLETDHCTPTISRSSKRRDTKITPAKFTSNPADDEEEECELDYDIKVADYSDQKKGQTHSTIAKGSDKLSPQNSLTSVRASTQASPNTELERRMKQTASSTKKERHAVELDNLTPRKIGSSKRRANRRTQLKRSKSDTRKSWGASLDSKLANLNIKECSDDEEDLFPEDSARTSIEKQTSFPVSNDLESSFDPDDLIVMPDTPAEGNCKEERLMIIQSPDDQELIEDNINDHARSNNCVIDEQAGLVRTTKHVDGDANDQHHPLGLKSRSPLTKLEEIEVQFSMDGTSASFARGSQGECSMGIDSTEELDTNNEELHSDVIAELSGEDRDSRPTSSRPTRRSKRAQKPADRLGVFATTPEIQKGLNKRQKRKKKINRHNAIKSQPAAQRPPHRGARPSDRRSERDSKIQNDAAKNHQTQKKSEATEEQRDQKIRAPIHSPFESTSFLPVRAPSTAKAQSKVARAGRKLYFDIQKKEPIFSSSHEVQAANVRPESKEPDSKEPRCWSSEQIDALRKAHQNADLTTLDFWGNIASYVQGKSANECRNRWLSTVSTPAIAKTKTSTHRKDEPPRLEDDADDFFDATPARDTVGTTRKSYFHKMDLGSPVKTCYTSTVAAVDSGGSDDDLFSQQRRCQPKPTGYKSFVNNMRRQTLKEQKQRKTKKKSTKEHVGGATKIVQESVFNHDVDIQARLTPGGTLKVKGGDVEDDGDDFWCDGCDSGDELE